MPEKRERSGGDLFIVDNSHKDWKVLRYLKEWIDLANSFDIATGHFEIGALLGLEGQWQKLDRIRILMGDEVTKRTRQALLAGVERAKKALDLSIEKEKETNDFLSGVPAIVEALRPDYVPSTDRLWSCKIECRVYTKDKFHAKAYITDAKQAVIGPSALVGSSNFSLPGLTENVELNIQIRREVDELQDWFERHWQDAHDITPEILKVIERHTREYAPFLVYAKALQEFFRGHEMTASEWELAGPENGGSTMFAVLDQYQKEGYQALMKIARQHGGAFLCDGVGLGKTFIGLMLIERLVVHERKRVALFVPKTARDSVWEMALKQYLNYIKGDFSNLVIFNHTDLSRGRGFPERFQRIGEMADVIVIDEAHHFRNPGVTGTGERRPSRYRVLYDLIDGLHGPKHLFLLTATPINNKLDDLRHMIELFSRRQEDYFKTTVGIHSLRGHFVKMERELERTMLVPDNGDVQRETNMAEAGRVLTGDELFRALVVQRSRAYAKESQLKQGATLVSFPTREPPRVVDYSLEETYGDLIAKVERAFAKDKPLFSLAIYYPLAYYKGPDDSIDSWLENRQKQVVGLIRTQFLKRFESSAHVFELSCVRLFLKLLAFAARHSETEAEQRRLERWKLQHQDLIAHVQEQQSELSEDEEADEDLVTDEMLDHVDYLSRDEYKVEEILSETFLDLDQAAEFLKDLRLFQSEHDDKLRALVELLTNDSDLKQRKVLIFTEFAETARYLRKELQKKGIDGVDEVDSTSKGDRAKIIRSFAPYYNGSSSSQLKAEGLNETRVLISTDVLSEGLNLQDATRLINFDIHWNPVRLMQRIGRVDRRMNPETESKLLADHPDQKVLRGKIAYWNFLPPEELDRLLNLYSKVSHKTLRISKTFGIEGRKILTPDDEFEALKNFNQAYEGSTTPVEEMKLELQELFQRDPELEARLNALPGRVFSGKEHPSKGARAVFFCYALPGQEHVSGASLSDNDEFLWTEEAGKTAWYLYDLETEKIVSDATDIVELIRCKPETPRRCNIEKKTLSQVRKRVERHIKNTYLKRVQAPIGVKPILKAWMELS